MDVSDQIEKIEQEKRHFAAIRGAILVALRACEAGEWGRARGTLMEARPDARFTALTETVDFWLELLGGGHSVAVRLRDALKARAGTHPYIVSGDEVRGALAETMQFSMEDVAIAGAGG